MYSADQTHRLQKLTTTLLTLASKSSLDEWLEGSPAGESKGARTGSSEKPGKDRLDEPREILRFHEYRYAIMNDPLISDFEDDSLYKALGKVQARHPGRVTPDSPTQRA